MVGIFSAESSQPLQGSAVTPKQAPEMPKNMLLGMLAGAVGVGADIFKHQQSLDAAQAIRDQKTAADAAKNKVISGVSIQYANVVQAKLSGKYDDNRAYLEMNKIWQDANLKYSEYGQDLANLHAQAMGGGFASKEFDRVGFEEKKRQDAVDLAVKEGFGLPNASPEDQDKMVYDRRQFLENQRAVKYQADRMRGINARLQNERGLVGLQRDQLEFEKAKAEQAGNVAARGLVAQQYKIVANKAETIVAEAFKSGNPDAMREADKQLALLESTTMGMINDVAPDANKSRLGQYTTPMLNIIKMQRDRLSNPSKFNREFLDRTISTNQMILLSNMKDTEKMAVASSKLVNAPGVAGTDAAISVTNALNRYAQIADPYQPIKNTVSDSKEDVQDNTTVLEFMKSKTFNALNNKGDQQYAGVVDEGRKNMDRMLQAVVDDQGNIKSYNSIKPYIDFLSSSDGKKWVEEVGFSPKVKDGLNALVASHYQNQIETMLSGEWSNKGSTTAAAMARGVSWEAPPNDIPAMKESFDYKLVGDSVKIIPKANQPAGAKDINQYSDQVNKFETSVNKYVMLIHNLRGDPVEKIYNEVVLPTVFGVKPEEAKNAP